MAQIYTTIHRYIGKYRKQRVALPFPLRTSFPFPMERPSFFFFISSTEFIRSAIFQFHLVVTRKSSANTTRWSVLLVILFFSSPKSCSLLIPNWNWRKSEPTPLVLLPRRSRVHVHASVERFMRVIFLSPIHFFLLDPNIVGQIFWFIPRHAMCVCIHAQNTVIIWKIVVSISRTKPRKSLKDKNPSRRTGGLDTIKISSSWDSIDGVVKIQLSERCCRPVAIKNHRQWEKSFVIPGVSDSLSGCIHLHICRPQSYW